MDACEFDRLLTRNVPHILEKIFFSIDYASFKKCLEVSKSWNDILKTESFLKRGTTLFWEEIHDELRLAAKEGNVDTIISLLSSFQANVNYQGYHNGMTPLHWAAVKGHKDVVLLLLDRGADPNSTFEDRWTPVTPLHWAANLGHKDVVLLLLNRGVDPNLADEDGWTPLHWAVRKGHKDVVLLLLQKGADPNMATNYGLTPLALEQGAFPNTDIANILKEYGATV